MSRARTLADLLDSSGDVKSANLDNVAIANLSSTASGIDVTGTVTADDLMVLKDQNAITIAEIDNNTAGTNAASRLRTRSDTSRMDVTALSGSYTTSNQYVANSGLAEAIGSQLGLSAYGATPIVLYTNNTERMQITSTGNVEMGGNLDVSGSVEIDTTSPIPLDIKSTHSNGGYILLQMGASGATLGHIGAAAQLITGGAASDLCIRSETDLVFSSLSSERMRITSTGNVGIGTSSPVSGRNVHINNSSSWASLRFTGAGGNHLDIKSYGNTTSGSIIELGGDQPLRIYTNGTEKLRIQSGGGISFNGDTAAANALDDYEEGTWTPTVSGSTTAGSYTVSVASSGYTKIGRQVTVQCEINYINTSGAGSGYLKISGLPFTTTGSHIGNVQANSGLDFPTDTFPTWYLTGTTSHFRCPRINKGTMFQIPVPTANTNYIYLRLTATYQTN